MASINLHNALSKLGIIPQSEAKNNTQQKNIASEEIFNTSVKTEESEASLSEIDDFASLVDEEMNAYENTENIGKGGLAAIKDFGANVLDLFKSQVTPKDIFKGALAAKDAEGPKEWLKIFGSKTAEAAAINMVNDAIDSQPIDKVSDAEISNTKEFNNLTNQDMLLLNNISYSGIAKPENVGKTLGEVSYELKELAIANGGENAIDENGDITIEGVKALVDAGYDIGVTCNFLETETEDLQMFADMLNKISNDDNLSELTILDNADVNENGINATTYGRLDSNGKLMENATVVFQGTIGSEGWKDNVESLTTVTPQQEAAYEYIQKQEEVLKEYSNGPEVHLTVSGHSKGGNLAMFSTIENEKDSSSNIVIDNCLSFDGEGFNADFVEENEDAINSCKTKITSINAYVDPVNLLLQDIAGEKYYVGVDYMKLETDKKGNPKLNETDDFKKFAWDAHSPTTMYKKVCDDDGQWTLYNESEIATELSNTSDDIENMGKTTKSILVALVKQFF